MTIGESPFFNIADSWLPKTDHRLFHIEPLGTPRVLRVPELDDVMTVYRDYPFTISMDPVTDHAFTCRCGCECGGEMTAWWWHGAPDLLFCTTCADAFRAGDFDGEKWSVE